MSTETQRNYKKQMKELQKELEKKNTQDDGFYSYIDRDYVKSYYQKRKKRKIVISASVIGVVIILWNSYAIYTWLTPVYYSLTGKVLPTIGKVLDVEREKHREVAEYLSKVDINKELEGKNLDYRTINLTEAIKGNIERTEYFNNIEKYSNVIKSDITRIESIKCPEVMKYYHNLVLERLKICNSIYERTMEIRDISNINEINQCIKETNELIHNYSTIGNRSRDEMINVFNDIGMDYKLENGKIHYWWKK